MMTLNPLVSIITPLYRGGDTLPTALNSVLRQSEGRWEAIIVDDGSPDDSRSVAEQFAKSDSRFRVLGQANAGACAARNTGLKIARGKYVLFLDADDWLEPNALADLIHACDRKNLSAVHGGFKYARPDGTPTQWTGTYDGASPLFDALASSNVLSLPSCVMLLRSLVDELGGFDPSLAHCGDWDLWARVARTNCRVGSIADCVTGYRMRMASLSRNSITLLRDAAKVLGRIHAPDARVRRPQRGLAQGANPKELPARLAGFTLYAGALAAMQGNLIAATTGLDSLEHWPAIEAQRVAEFLIHAACFSRCIAPDDLHPVPSDIQATIDWVSLELSRRTQLPNLPDQIAAELTGLGFGRNQEMLRDANRMRLGRPPAADETHALAYLRSLALQECVA